MNKWTNGKSLMKRHCQKNDDFYSQINIEDNTDSDYDHSKKSL